jgi:cytochrome c peroxidase
MHDGRFATLREVVEFYDSGIEDSPDLDPRLRASDGSPRRLHLTAAERDALVAFLNTLTDPAFLRAERFSDPFPCRSTDDPK